MLIISAFVLSLHLLQERIAAFFSPMKLFSVKAHGFAFINVATTLLKPRKAHTQLFGQLRISSGRRAAACVLPLQPFGLRNKITVSPGNSDCGGTIAAIMKDLPVGHAGDIRAGSTASFLIKALDGDQCSKSGLLSEVLKGICALLVLAASHKPDQSKMIQEFDVSVADWSRQLTPAFMFLMVWCAQQSAAVPLQSAQLAVLYRDTQVSYSDT